MKLACFYPGSLYCAWSLATGLVDTLERMGHEVLPLPIETMSNSLSCEDRSVSLRNLHNYPTSGELREYDGILLFLGVTCFTSPQPDVVAFVW